MKIGIVCYPTFGGSGVVATELGKALAKKGHKVHFITYNQPVRLGSFKENIFYHEVRVSDYPLFDYQPYELVLASKMYDVAKHEKLDLLHVHYAIPHASAAYMASQILKREGINLPVVTTLHGTDITLVGKDPSFEPVITFAINESTEVTAVSDSLKADTHKYFEIKKNIHVIPNFVCIHKYPKEQDAELKNKYAPNGEQVITHISNFRKVKRITDVIKTFEEIRKKIPVKLLMVGDGPERNPAELLSRELDLCEDITFLGNVQHPDKVLQISDLFLLPSEFESFGLSALEAMACRVPVISTNSGGLSEVNEHGFSGYLSPVGDINDMATNALKILSTKETLDTFKTNALEQARKFDINVILPEYEKLYQKLIKV